MASFWTFSLLEASLCPISPINSITCFLISLDFGYISCFFLPYVHFSHHGLLVFLRHGLFLDIFTSWSSIMSNFSHRPYHLFSDFPWFWIYFLLFLPYVHFSHHGLLVFPDMASFWTYSLLEASLCPISLINPILCLLIPFSFGHITFYLLHYVQFHYQLLSPLPDC